VRFFARRYRTIAYNARGYPPSDVPDKPEAYSQGQAAEDILGILDHLRIPKAHICGLSMGGYAVLHFGLRHPERALSLTVAGAGYGSVPGERERFRKDVDETARRFDRSSTTSSSRSPRRATRSPCAGCRCRGRPSSSWRPRWRSSRCRP
jgi:pimeloyl-ACP methyl ester carboxylesterase